jgi:hypothetical protein
MGIEVAWVNERHEVKQIVGDSHQVVSRLATTRWFRLATSKRRCSRHSRSVKP